MILNNNSCIQRMIWYKDAMVGRCPTRPSDVHTRTLSDDCCKLCDQTSWPRKIACTKSMKHRIIWSKFHARMTYIKTPLEFTLYDSLYLQSAWQKINQFSDNIATSSPWIGICMIQIKPIIEHMSIYTIHI